MIAEKLLILQKRMALRLEEIRASHSHRGNIGANVEDVVREFLREYLPAYNRIGQGEVIDLSESISTQLDVVITNEYHPFLNDLTSPSVFFVEGVAAVGEVKSVLQSKDIDIILANCVRFKALSPKIPKGATARGVIDDLNRFFIKRPFFLFAFESQVALETLKARIDAYNAANSLPITSQVDGIFLLDKGGIINYGTGGGALKFGDPKTGVSHPGFNIITIEQNPSVLLEFLGWLCAILPLVNLPSSPLAPYLVAQK